MNLPLRLGFESPGYAWLLLALPVMWWWGWGRLRQLGGLRRWLALLARSLVWIGVVAALAGVQLVWVSDRVTVMYVLDQSESIPQARRREMLDHVIMAVRRHRQAARGDRAGVIAFGRDATIEIPPFDDDIPSAGRLESLLERTDATNLEAALNLAQASMPEDTARRVVIVTDGNENVGEARRMASRVVASGIGIDVVPIQTEADSEILVEKIDLPANIRQGQPFEARVVIDHQQRGTPKTDDSSGTEDAPGTSERPVRGRLRVTQSVGGEESLLIEETVELQPGKNVFPLRHQIDQPAAFTYEAEFIPDSDQDDGLQQNNSATGYTYIRGKGRVLLIHDPDQLGDYELLISSLRNANVEVVPMATDQLFTSIAELQPYDAVILGGVARVAGESTESIRSFSDQQIEMLVRNTQQLGAGLLMIGGPQSLGAGGWSGTELEKVMPVDFRIKNRKVQAVGALALIMHASEMPQGNYWQKVIAGAAVEQLGGADLAGVAHWTMNGDAWLWGGRNGLLEVGPNRKAMLAAIGRMTPGDMPQFDPAMRMVATALTRASASVKHCIIISDGDPSDPSAAVIQAFKDNNITISTVAVESHGLSDSQRLRRIAAATGGKYYSVKSGRALPSIFQREARRVSRPLVYEPPGGVVPQVVFPHVVMEGIESALPPVSGFVLTQTKDSPLAQVVVQSPKPNSAENATILATWNVGLGRSAVLTTDAGARWASAWSQWDGYEKFHSQLVRWLMRPTGDTGQFTLATKTDDGEVEVVVTALNPDDTYQNFLQMAGSVLGPDLNPIPLRIRQTAPGRYTGSFPVDQAGTYFVNVLPGAGNAPLSTGVTVPYSEEFRYRDTNEALITRLASLRPTGGEPGEVTVPLLPENADQLLANDPFRGGLPPARRIRDFWPWVVLFACVVFFADVLFRRISIGFGFLATWWQQLRGQAAPAEATARLDQLRQSKQAAGRSMQQGLGGARYVPPPSASSPSELDGNDMDVRPERHSATSSEPTSGSAEAGKSPSYTERLLEAKRKANRDNRR